MRGCITLLALIHLLPFVTTAQAHSMGDDSVNKLQVKLVIDVFQKIEDSKSMYMHFTLPEESFQRDVLGFRFDPEKDPNAYLTYEMNEDDLNGTEIGVSLNYSGNFLVTYHFAIDLKKK